MILICDICYRDKAAGGHRHSLKVTSSPGTPGCGKLGVSTRKSYVYRHTQYNFANLSTRGIIIYITFTKYVSPNKFYIDSF